MSYTSQASSLGNHAMRNTLGIFRYLAKISGFFKTILDASRLVSTIQVLYMPPFAYHANSQVLLDSWRELERNLNDTSEVDAVLDVSNADPGNMHLTLTVRSRDVL